MIRKTRKNRRRRDDTWVVKEDEFHPNLKVAATEADKLARVAALKNAKEEMARAERRLLATNAEEAHRTGLVQTVAEWVAEIARIEDEIKANNDDTEEN